MMAAVEDKGCNGSVFRKQRYVRALKAELHTMSQEIMRFERGNFFVRVLHIIE